MKAAPRLGFVLVAIAAGCTAGGRDDFSSASSPLGESQVAVPSGSVLIKGIGGKCLSLAGDSEANGTKAELRECSSVAPAQRWTFSNGQVHSPGGKCLDVLGNVSADGTRVGVWDCWGGPNQQWTLDGDHSLRGLGGKCLDVTGGAVASGTPIILWSCHAPVQSNQQWTAVSADSAPSGPSSPPSSSEIDPFAPSNLYPTSIFKRQVPANPRLAPNSSALIGQLLKPGPGAVDMRTDAVGGDWNTPLYVTNGSDPAYTIVCDMYGGNCPVKGTVVHIPSFAKAEHGSDAHLSIVDLATGYEYNLWQASTDGRGTLNTQGNVLHVSWGGRSKLGSDGLNAEGNHAGYAASAVMLYPKEIISGRIDHALGIGVDCADNPAVYPAILSNTDSACNTPNSPYYGMHLQLAMSDAEISALNTSPYEKTILTALAHYGAYVYDTGNPQGAGYLAASYLTYTTQGLPDPWRSTILPALKNDGLATGSGDYWQLAPLFGGAGINWAQKLRVIAPCVDAQNCN